MDAKAVFRQESPVIGRQHAGPNSWRPGWVAVGAIKNRMGSGIAHVLTGRFSLGVLTQLVLVPRNASGSTLRFVYVRKERFGPSCNLLSSRFAFYRTLGSLQVKQPKDLVSG